MASIAAVTDAAPADLEIRGPVLTLRYATPDDAPALLELASDPAVTRYFSWGPYTSIEQPLAYIAGLPERRERGEQLDLLVVHRDDGPIGVTGLSELVAARPPRHRRLLVRAPLVGERRELRGEGADRRAGLRAPRPRAPRRVGQRRNGRMLVSLERIGFRREGTLAAWHRHGDEVHDVVVFGLTRAAWERSELRRVPAEVTGTPPPAFTVI